jgi:hypothetical protein
VVDLQPVHEAVYAALDALPQTFPVWGAAPDAADYPYIVIGDPTQTPDFDLDVPSSSSTLTLHGWANTTDMADGYAMLEFIRGRLDHADIGAGVWGIFEEFATVIDASEPDTPLIHAVARYRIRHN